MIATVAAGRAGAAPLRGTYASPLGALAVSEKGGDVAGRIADANNPCGFAKGELVLDGSRLDDSIVGVVRACKVGDGCTGKVEGAAMLLITRNGAAISGAVHLEAGGCKTPLQGDSIALRRGAAAPPKKAQPADAGPGAVKVDGHSDPHADAGSSKKGTPRQRAERLAQEAQGLMQQSEGNAEAARAKFLEAVRIDPTYAEGLNGVGVTYYARDRYDEALDFYKQAIEANPALGDGYYNIGCVYALKGDAAQAIRYLKIALLNGYVQLETLSNDDDLKSLAGNPEFEKLKAGKTD